MPRQHVPVLTYTSSEDSNCYHSQIILGHFYYPDTQECVSQVVHKRGVPSATGKTLKCKARRLFYPNMTKQGLLVHLITLQETPGIYPHCVCLSKGAMLSQVLPSEPCSSFSAQLPPFPLILQGKQQRGLPQAQCAVWEQERKCRDNSP